MIDLLTAQLMEPFRIVLLVGLTITQWNTRHQTGALAPLALGVVFVAALIPLTMGPGAASIPVAIGIGIAANLIILLPLLGLRRVIFGA